LNKKIGQHISFYLEYIIKTHIEQKNKLAQENQNE